MRPTGIYECAKCGSPLFDPAQKLNSHNDWPSFWQPIRPDLIKLSADKSGDTIRTSVECARCGVHLGHVYNDGPLPTGLRYRLNPVAIKFLKAESSAFPS